WLETELGNLPRNLGDADRAAELVSALPADDHVPEVGQRRRDDELRLTHAETYRFQRAGTPQLRRVGCRHPTAAHDATYAGAAEAVLDLLALGDDPERQRLSTTINLDGELPTRRRADDPQDLVERIDPVTLDLQDHVAWHETCRGCRRIRHHLVDARRRRANA